jgi:gamma-glutamylputrescine oxidase
MHPVPATFCGERDAGAANASPTGSLVGVAPDASMGASAAAKRQTVRVGAASIDDNAACWLAELPPWKPGPPLAADLHADVVIIGGGLTGISTAWHMAEAAPDRRIVVLEARSLANGATGRSGGQVLSSINGIEPSDPESACQVRSATLQGIAIAEELATHSTLDVGFRRSGSFEVTTTARSAEEARRRVERSNAWDIPLAWLPPAETGLYGVHGAVLDPDGARMNPAALVRGLRAPLQERGVSIFENSAVTSIREGATVEVTTSGGRVRAGAMVLATNAYTPSLGYFRGRILPLHSRVVATSPLTEPVWSGLGWAARGGFSDDLDRIAYGCRTPGGRLLFGGGANSAYTYRFGGSPVTPDTPHGFADIERKFGAYFPGVPAAIEHRWSGPLAITFDRVCSMGVLGEHRNVYYALGYSGHGLALAALAGRVLRDLYAGNHDDWRQLPFYQRRMPWIPPEPFRWVGYQAYTRATGRSPRRR